jgi:hypothetical protein
VHGHDNIYLASTLESQVPREDAQPDKFLITCVFGFTEVLSALLAQITKNTKSHVNERENFLAVKYRKTKCLALLLSAPIIGTDFRDSGSGRSALHQAVQAERLDLVQLLISSKANVNAADYDDNIPCTLRLSVLNPISPWN